MCHVGNNGLEDMVKLELESVGKEGRLVGLYAEEVGRLRSWNLKDRNGKRNVGVNAFRFVDTWHFAVAIRNHSVKGDTGDSDVMLISPLACFLAGPVSGVVDITYKFVVSGYFPVDEAHGCWTKSKQNPVLPVSASVVVSTLFVCT